MENDFVLYDEPQVLLVWDCVSLTDLVFPLVCAW